MNNLLDFSRNIHSQNGEDGVLAELFRRMNITHGQFVEFGAWDGVHLSNTYNLLKQGWAGVYIEGEASRFADLKRTQAQFPAQLQTIQAWVRHEGEETLDKLLSCTGLPQDFTLLSVDIDSYDWQVWHSLTHYRPLVVVIEVNSGIAPGLLQVHVPPGAQGASFSSMAALGKAKGYALACHTGNMVFVSQELAERAGITQAEQDAPEMLFNWPMWLNGRMTFRQRAQRKLRRVWAEKTRRPNQK